MILRGLLNGLLSVLVLSSLSLPAHAVMEDYPAIKLQGLDKSVGRTVTFEVAVGSTIQYGQLFVKIHACRKAPPIEKPESAAFLQIWEVPPGSEKSEWVFSGWMFASSPALSAMDHPVYDIWVLDCTGREEPKEEIPPADENAEGTTDASAATTPENTPAAEVEDIVPATDSEAEEGPEPAAPQTTQPLTLQEGVAPSTSPAIETPSPDPSASQELDTGVTAYDFMKQPSGTGARPQTQVEEEAPDY